MSTFSGNTAGIIFGGLLGAPPVGITAAYRNMPEHHHHPHRGRRHRREKQPQRRGTETLPAAAASSDLSSCIRRNRDKQKKDWTCLVANLEARARAEYKRDNGGRSPPPEPVWIEPCPRYPAGKLILA